MDLADRIEAAEGSSRELDAEIWRACFDPPKWRNPHWANYERFTASLDAAMKLVPEGCSLNFEGCTFIKCDSGEWRQAVTNGPAHQLSHRLTLRKAATPALALCAAALRARAKDAADD